MRLTLLHDSITYRGFRRVSRAATGAFSRTSTRKRQLSSFGWIGVGLPGRVLRSAPAPGSREGSLCGARGGDDLGNLLDEVLPVLLAEGRSDPALGGLP